MIRSKPEPRTGPLLQHRHLDARLAQGPPGNLRRLGRLAPGRRRRERCRWPPPAIAPAWRKERRLVSGFALRAMGDDSLEEEKGRGTSSQDSEQAIQVGRERGCRSAPDRDNRLLLGRRARTHAQKIRRDLSEGSVR